MKDDRMREIDKTVPSPEDRALAIWQQVSKLDLESHDLFCFAVHVCAQNAMIAKDDDLEVIVKALGRWLYNYHYQLFEPEDSIEKDKEILLDGIQQIVRLSDNNGILLGKDLSGSTKGGDTPISE